MGSVIISGDKRLQSLLGGLEEKVQKKLVRHALRESAKIVRDAAKVLVPVDTGELRDSLKVQAMPRKKNKIGIQVVASDETLNKGLKQAKKSGAAFSGTVFYGAFVELGTSKMQARPFLRPALDQNRQRCLNVFADDIRDSVEEAENE